jgi:hypothetical protein
LFFAWPKNKTVGWEKGLILLEQPDSSNCYGGQSLAFTVYVFCKKKPEGRCRSGTEVVARPTVFVVKSCHAYPGVESEAAAFEAVKHVGLSLMALFSRFDEDQGGECIAFDDPYRGSAGLVKRAQFQEHDQRAYTIERSSPRGSSLDF